MKWTATTSIVVVLGVVLCVTGLFLYQLRRAEAGRTNFVPHAVRRLVAAREYRSAKIARYESARLNGYLKVAGLDGQDFPDAWSYLCGFQVRYKQWIAARLSCQRAVELQGRTVSNLNMLAEAYKHLGEWRAAADIYSEAANLDPQNERLREEAMWMFLAAHNYEEAAAAASSVARTSGEVYAARVSVILGFADLKLRKDEQARAAYEFGLPGLRSPSCSLEYDAECRPSLVCSGISRKTGRQVSECIGNGCK